ncbi:5-methyltetrahydropteroyltriglutamate--homocysteine S-methyltransferase [Clostridium beijerinckii]|uniref:5-methyltetrahydropteroyltriglutamate--homocysteine methyltransferase n=1 Tax=Clostridium beijerinckii TaxID=1520 RepID=A0AAE5LN80_CLOBE|nr:5-methyltetrahydropteroyltriglutamate--homocysteine S-methyltransferase [Clostridium beijerinckii]NSB12291.1 5-methyltetrahydropteroyltriglutamate--homocysteine methyltransferase [Clostridium beijerinckii]OOM30825.1 5-methyltetrahydropteroyltriglutamate--homocysteine methyltransferase [Clostridium beijerinckii]
MKKSTIVGYPRIGVNRELKKAVEGYFKGDLILNELQSTAKLLRKEYWETQKEKGIDYIPSNDFSFYDNMLDMAILLGVIPKRYSELNLSPIDTYFAMARGYQKNDKDVKALRMKKWFNTNYHYMVPEIEEDMQFSLNDTKPYDLYKEAKELGVTTRPVVIGPFTFLKLSRLKTTNTFEKCLEELVDVYIEILSKFEADKVEWIQIDEPILATDLTVEDIILFKKAYKKLLDKKVNTKILIQTYFGDVRDIYNTLIELDFDGIGLDLIEGRKNLEIIEKYGFPKNKLLEAGIVNGKNIWRNDYKKSIEIIKKLEEYVEPDNICLSTSCSLLHVPHTLRAEVNMNEKYKESLAFAEEKLGELEDLKKLDSNSEYIESDIFKKNQEILERKNTNSICYNTIIRSKVENLKEEDFIRKEKFEERNKIQKELFKLPILPTTTIGSFPQTSEIRGLRQQFKKDGITQKEYEDKIKEKINEVIKFQEEIDLDVLVHGEYERNDMVEYFGEQLEGFLFTQNGWVQSYGTRGVKPPIIFGDVERTKPMTVNWIKYAQEQTAKIMKGMLTGPITILNWSFPREDLSLREIAYQIGLAINEEVLDLEKAGIKIIQIDEAALREKLPIRKEDWKKEYLDWAIPAFRLTASKVKPETQIHTHMCYSEFSDIINEIQDMDVDAITIEAARSDFSLLDFLKEKNFKPEIGPGVYDIHSPRVPSEEELEKLINIMMDKLDVNKLWINPDCGLKTRGIEETKLSLINMIKATKTIREQLKK